MEYELVRRIDDLGRVVIPKEIRKSLNIEAGDQIQIEVVGPTILLSKVALNCALCGATDRLKKIGRIYICQACENQLKG